MSYLIFKFACQVNFRDFNKEYSKDDFLVFTTPYKYTSWHHCGACTYIYIYIGKIKRKYN